MRASRLVPVVVLCAATACGTTVPYSNQVLAGGPRAGLGGAEPLTGEPGSQPLGQGGAAPLGPSKTVTPGSPTGVPGAPTRAPGTTATRVPSATALPSSGPGWDQKYVYVGVTTQKDTSRTFASVGYDGIDPGDTEAQANAAIARINARGGLLGRQLKPVFKDVPLLESATNPESYASSVCTHFSQDKRVVAVVNIVLTMDTDNFRTCFAKAKIPLFNVELTATDEGVQSRLTGFLYTTVVPTWDSLAPVLVDRLVAQRYFQGWDVRLQRVDDSKPKVGVLVMDDPTGARIAKVIVRALKARGYGDVVTFAYAPPGNNIGPAITYFAGNRVTHVISSDIEQLTFQLNARTQQYYPRYAVHTNNNPLGLATVGDQKSQVGSVGVGWAPAYDVAQSEDPGVWSAGERDCLAAMKKGGVVNKGRLAVAFGLAVCDGLELFAQGAALGGHFRAAAVRSGLDRLAAGYSPAATFRSGIRSGRSFVPGGVRDLAWFGDCSCFRYVSAATRAL